MISECTDSQCSYIKLKIEKSGVLNHGLFVQVIMRKSFCIPPPIELAVIF